MYDKENGFWLGFSCGKDSQALYHMAQLAGVKFKGYFSPTTVDPPEVIRFLRKNYPEIETTKVGHSIYDEFVKRKCLPLMRIRWCCAEFKEKGGEGKVVLVGVRHEESLKRSKRKEVEVTGKQYSGDLEGFKDWSKAKIEKKKQKLAKKDKNFDQFSEHTEHMVTCINGKDKIVISPIIDWTERDVWEFLNNVVEVPHCCLYDEGWHRIGCICCPMAGRKDTLRDIKRWPHVKEKWIKSIMQVRKESIEGYGLPSMQERMNRWTDGTGEKYLPHINANSREYGAKFLDSTCKGCAVTGAENDSTREREIAENIFDWWISKKSYKQWYSEKFEQGKIKFE